MGAPPPELPDSFRSTLPGAALVIIDEDGQRLDARQHGKLRDTGSVNDRPGRLPPELHAGKRCFDPLGDRKSHCDCVIWGTA
jgi:hypothetical protein